MIFKYTITQVETLKSFLTRHDFSKKTVSAIKNNGALIVNNEHVTVRKLLQIGDQLTIHLPEEYPSINLEPYDSPLDILYEDSYVIIVNKPREQNCTPSREHPHHSLIEQVLAYLQQEEAPINPHIVTRLDRNTTGIVVFAKSGHIHHLFSTVQFEKYYICLVNGKTDAEGIIEGNIARSPNSIITREVSPHGKYAKTSYKTLRQNEKFSLCKVKLHTGRTHQIRVHFQFIGHPIVGDELYGGAHEMVPSQCLQCSEILFNHPIEKKKISINIDYEQYIQLLNTL